MLAHSTRLRAAPLINQREPPGFTFSKQAETASRHADKRHDGTNKAGPLQLRQSALQRRRIQRGHLAEDTASAVKHHCGGSSCGQCARQRKLRIISTAVSTGRRRIKTGQNIPPCLEMRERRRRRRLEGRADVGPISDSSRRAV